MMTRSSLPEVLTDGQTNGKIRRSAVGYYTAETDRIADLAHPVELPIAVRKLATTSSLKKAPD